MAGRSVTRELFGAAALWVLCLSQPALAGSIGGQVGLDALIARLGLGNQPTGAGVAVAQVETNESPGNYGPNQADGEFLGKTFTAVSGPPGVSGHATLVGQLYYGAASSISPGISNVYLYSSIAGSAGWLLGDFLRTFSGQQPLITPGGVKVFNNSWIAIFTNNIPADNDALRRADYVMTRDRVLMVNGVSNGGPSVPLMSHLFNGITVGVTGGTHTSGPTLITHDGPGRMKPEIVAPGQFTSFSTPIVSGAVALMTQTARTFPGLSNNAKAERPEVLKAVLLAGANHRTGPPTNWSNNPVMSGPNRGVTFTPLDPVYGVDVVNVNNSHLILTGLQQLGATAVPAAATIQSRGWDLLSMTSGSSRWYRFRVSEPIDELSVLATWNRVVPNTFASWTLANFDLVLWRVDGSNQAVTLVGDAGLGIFGSGNVVSQSTLDNVEHLYVRDLQPGDYAIQVKRVDALGGTHDAAVAWLMPFTALPGDMNGDGLVNFDDVLIAIMHWGPCPGPPAPCPGDADGSGSVNFDDILLMIANWS